MVNVNLLLRRARIGPVGPMLKRGAKELGEAAASRTCIVVMMAPFAGWALLLMWGQARLSDALVMRAIADGPRVVFALWAMVVTIWFAIAFAFGHYRHSLAIGLGLLAATVAIRMSHGDAARDARNRTAPWGQQPPQDSASEVR